ncbi:MAG: NAD(P)-binding domain-containing protein [Candidatus Aminicenantes bacterium]|nr:NAD(P)-binding domain-containing protein [Candidatus Aminicenantes bacterium]
MGKKVLVATEKPFAKVAVNGIADILNKAGYEMILLESYKAKDDLIKAAVHADAIIFRSDIVDEAVLAAGSGLKIVVRAGAGYDNVDLNAATARKVVVMNTPGQNSNAVAELVFALMLYLVRGAFSGKSGSELRGKKIGLQAYGAVGRCVTPIAKGFGMEVFAFDPYVPAEAVKKDGVTPAASLEELYKKCDFVSLHIPKTKETLNSINFALLSQMKKGAVLINTARAEVIDEPSLLKMFAERPDFRYGADVAPVCLPEIAEKYAGRFVFTAKKMGAQTEEANVNAGLAAARQIVAFFEKGDKTFQVNK